MMVPLLKNPSQTIPEATAPRRYTPSGSCPRFSAEPCDRPSAAFLQTIQSGCHLAPEVSKNVPADTMTPRSCLYCDLMLPEVIQGFLYMLEPVHLPSQVVECLARILSPDQRHVMMILSYARPNPPPRRPVPVERYRKYRSPRHHAKTPPSPAILAPALAM